MSRVERAAELLKSALPPERTDVPPVPPALVAKAREALKGSKRRDVWTKRLVPMAAAAVLAAAVTAVWAVRARAPVTELSVASSEGAVVLTPSEGAAVALAPGMAVDQGATVTTHAGGNAQLKLKSGGEVEVFESSELFVERAATEQRLVVREGGTRLHVKPLKAGHKLVVATEDAEVEVKGTRFEVEVRQVDAACDVATPTRVHVDEGTVWVKHGSDEIVLQAGASWPTCGAAVMPAPVVEKPAPVEVVAPKPIGMPPRDATLAEQNARYREAIAARRRGDAQVALQLFEGFYKAHPKSPMAEAARVEQLRLLLKVKSPAAADAAREYLEQYPRGFARDEAKAALGQ
jgi:hypothetical protein